ncbi:MAG TPA: hypothetical protein VKT29_12700, partial [Terriglobales bacterium]|nr:hypothetical protein [Terriglobales bacterium]
MATANYLIFQDMAKVGAMHEGAAVFQNNQISVLVADKTPMGTSLLADALRRDRHFRVSTAFSSHQLCDQLTSN